MINNEQEEAKRIKLFKNTENSLMNKHGWVLHYVMDCPTKTSVDIHTHGLTEKFGHKEIQLVLPLDQDIAHCVVCNCVKMIKAGTVFTDGCIYDGIVENYKVKFIDTGDNLRIILPDEQGNLDESNMDGVFSIQYED